MQRFAKRLLVGYVRLVAGTTRWHVEGREHLEAALKEDGSAVVCFWHGRLMLFPVDWPCPTARMCSFPRIATARSAAP